MSAQESCAVYLALKYMLRSGCSATAAAAKYRVHTTSVCAALRRRGLAVAPRGRPVAPAPIPAQPLSIDSTERLLKADIQHLRDILKEP